MKGYTAVELLVAAGIIIGVVGIGLGLLTLAHFIVKLWQFFEWHGGVSAPGMNFRTDNLIA